MGPILRFQFGALSILIPSTKHPPGHRIKEGFRSARYCARSARIPFGLFLNVFSGNSDTKSSHAVPVLPKLMTNFALGSPAPACSLQAYFFQCAPAMDLNW